MSMEILFSAKLTAYCSAAASGMAASTKKRFHSEREDIFERSRTRRRTRGRIRIRSSQIGTLNVKVKKG